MSKEQKLFEEYLAYHCAPALKKYKLANMFHIPRTAIPCVDNLIREYNEKFADKHLTFRILQADKPRITIYLYSFEILENVLLDPEIRTFLEQYDYPIHSLSACLDHLDKRMEETDFPHEIGIFLGYPLSDVLGFINNEPCCCIGAWKVYSPKKAEYFKSLFKLFDHVRDQFINAIENGVRIEQLV